MLTYYAQCARDGHGRCLPDSLDRNLRKGREVGDVVVVRPVGPADPNAFDLVAVHAGSRPEAVGGVILQAERAVAPHVHLRERHARRVRQDRKDVTSAWQAGKLRAVKMGRDFGRREIDNGRAADGDAVDDGARTDLDVDGRREAEPHVDAFADKCSETRELER